MTIQEAIELALGHHQSGRLAEAEALYRQILAVEPRHAGALHLLGVIAQQMGRNDVAVDLIRQAIALAPGVPDFHSNLAMALYGKGQLDETVAACRHAIALNPQLPEAHNNLGNALRDKGQLDEAIAACGQAIALRPNYAEAHNNLGNVLRDKGQLDEAIASCRRAIALKPELSEAHCHLGAALRDKGQLDEAITSFRQAIALRPNYSEAHNNLGTALQDKGQLHEAVAAFRQAIALNPDLSEAHSNLGTALRDKGQLDEAITSFRQAIALRPNYSEAHNNLGTALQDKGQLHEAVAAFRQAIAFKRDLAEAHSNLGNALLDKGQLDEAIVACRQAIAFKHDLPEAHSNLGNALLDKGQLDEAVAAYHQAIALKPGFAEAHYNLGKALYGMGQLDEAITSDLRAIALKPDYSKAHNDLGNALLDKRQLDEAIASFRQAIAFKSKYPEAHSNLLLALNYHPGFDAPTIASEQRLWNQQHAEPLRQFIQPHPNDPSPERRLRIGYVSRDFREHIVGYNTLALLACHDRDHFEIFCYAEVARPDALTERFQASARHWRSIVGLTDEQFAAQIREDQIDILVDLALHTAHNRLLVFARKPAPVQATFAGYPGSTGLRTIDYRLSDPYLDPPGMDESIYSEQTLRLPHSFWYYDPLDCGDLSVNELPAAANGFITFGCLNDFRKINDAVLRLWARVLMTVPSSRLLLLAPEWSPRKHTLEVLGQEGVAGQRVEFIARQPRRRYLELYHRIDLGLDTLPYNGHTTSLDSFWMGVPVVTLVGQTIVGRAGLSQSMNLNLPELIAHTPEQYVEIAVGLAKDISHLTELRSTLRRRMEQCPLMDAPCFAQDMETAYRTMWHKWCLENQIAPP